jgi:hypothetical protein
MHVSKRTALGAAAIAAVAFAAPTLANPGNGTGGNGGPLACNDSVTGNKIGDITWTPTTIWPPNHKPTNVDITITTTDNDGMTTTVAAPSGTHNQYTSGVEDNGAGNTATDFFPGAPASTTDPGSATTTPQVRAERSGKDGTRIYDITVTCTKSPGAGAPAVENGTVHVLVSVPHDQGNHTGQG